MNTFMRSFLASLAAILVVAVSFLAGYLYHEYRFVASSDLPILQQAYNILLNHGYNDPPADPALEYGMIRGMLQAYADPYTSFSEPAQHELQTNTLDGSFGGIGATISSDADGNHILFPYPDSPAALAGVLEGDRLLAVDDLTVDAQTTRDALLSAIRGPVGEEVTLTVGRAPDYAPTQITVERGEISLPSVTWHLEPSDPRLGIIQINTVAATTPDEVQNAAADLQERGATGFVLDLRDNYGGLLDAGIDTARLFLESGMVIEQQYRGQEVQQYAVSSPGPLAELPLVVLVNQNTASAAEIIAGALQAHGRALLIGVPTYGKDTIQLIFELQDGSSLHVTAAHWWVPGLETPLGGNGLQPDLIVEASTALPDPLILAAIQALFSP